MKPLEMVEAGPKVAESEVAAFESRLGYRLPVDYRAFLLATNGGVPTRRGFDESTVTCFLSLHSDSKHEDIERKIDLVGWQFPTATIPIAKDPFGNYVLLSLAGDAEGGVFFFDHEEDEETPPLRIADSFAQFVSSLRRDSEFEDR